MKITQSRQGLDITTYTQYNMFSYSKSTAKNTVFDFDSSTRYSMCSCITFALSLAARTRQ